MESMSANAAQNSTAIEQDTEKNLVAQSSGRALRLFFIFLIGLLVTDQALLYTGRALIRGRYWKDQLLPNLAESQGVDAYVLGTCRASLHFDSKLISEVTGKQFFNAGKIVDALGNIDVALAILISHQKKGEVFFVLDDSTLEQSYEEVSTEVSRREIWMPLLEPVERQQMQSEYKISWLAEHSGLWLFRGNGQNFKYALKNFFARRPMPYSDGYDPRPPEQTILPNLENPAHLEASVKQTLNKQEFALKKIDFLIDKAIAHGLKPSIVSVPMHRLRATEKVNEEQRQLLKNLAKAKGIPYYDYLGNDQKISQEDALWSDVGHFNRSGAEKFSRIFGRDYLNMKKSTDEEGLRGRRFTQ